MRELLAFAPLFVFLGLCICTAAATAGAYVYGGEVVATLVCVGGCSLALGGASLLILLHKIAYPRPKR